jgi:hypothetical protein
MLGLRETKESPMKFLVASLLSVFALSALAQSECTIYLPELAHSPAGGIVRRTDQDEGKRAMRRRLVRRLEQQNFILSSHPADARYVVSGYDAWCGALTEGLFGGVACEGPRFAGVEIVDARTRQSHGFHGENHFSTGWAFGAALGKIPRCQSADMFMPRQ